MSGRKMIYLDDAINALERKKDKKAKGDIGGFYNTITQNNIDALKELPPAQPERQKGEWIYGEHDIAMCDGYRCDQCGFFVPWDYKYEFIDFIKDYHWCPSCGADMRGKQDE